MMKRINLSCGYAIAICTASVLALFASRSLSEWNIIAQQTRRLRRRRLHATLPPSASPSASPTWEVLYVTIEDTEFSGKQSGYEESPSNDHAIIATGIRRDNPSRIPSSSSIDGTGRMVIAAVSLACIVGAVLMALAVWGWRKKRWIPLGKGSDHGESQEFEEVELRPDAKHPQHKSAKAGASILRNRKTEAPEYNAGRRVRFDLPSPTAADHVVFESADINEGEIVDPKLMTPRKIRLKAGAEFIDTYSEATQLQTAPTPGTDPDSIHAGIAPRPIVRNDPETWVSRILHPWMDSPGCCPDQWDTFNCGQQSNPSSGESILDQSTIATLDHSTLDHSTIATNSFESNILNEISSVTPMLPTHPTSSKVSEDGDCKQAEDGRLVVSSSSAEQEISTGVLGIMGRQDAMNQAEDALVLEKISNTRMSTPPRDYGWDQAPGSQLPPSSVSSWRKRPWVNLDGPKSKRTGNTVVVEDIDRSPVDDEFDLESASDASGYDHGFHGRSGRLVEI